MSQRHRDILQDNRMSIIQDLDVKDVFDYLFQKRVLTERTMEDLNAIPEGKRQERAGKLLDIITRCGDRAFWIFCRALEPIYPHLGKLLTEAEKKATRYPSVEFPAPGSMEIHPVVEACAKALRDHYRTTYNKYYPLSWYAFRRLDTARVYIPNQLTRVDCSWPDMMVPISEDELSFSDIGSEDGLSLDEEKTWPNTLLQGPPGAGKTTFIYHQAYKWAKNENPKLQDVKLLFVLSARTMGDKDVLEEACDQLLPRGFLDESSVKDLENWIELNPGRAMFMIENIDETPNITEQDVKGPLTTKNPVLQYLQRKYLPKTRRVFTTRSTKLTTEGTRPIPIHIPPLCDAHYIFNGYSDAARTEYIEKFFSGDGEKAQSLKKAISVDECLQDIVRNPLYAVLVCILWENDQGKPSTCTEIFSKVIDLLERKYLEQSGHILTDEAVKETLGNLAKLGWDSIERDEYDFSIDKVKKTIGTLLPVEMGLIVKDPSKIEDRYKFQHKTFKEYFAAKYAMTRLEDKECQRMLWSPECISGQKYTNVCLFAAGILQTPCQGFFESMQACLSEMTSEQAPQCCVHDVITRACWAVSESGDMATNAPLVANSLLEEINLDFQRRPPKPGVIRGLAEVVKVLPANRLKAVDLGEMWIPHANELKGLGGALAQTKGIKSLIANVTRMDMSLSNPEEKDNSGILVFHQEIARNRSITHLTIEASIDTMSEEAIKAIPKAVQGNTTVTHLRLPIFFAKQCSRRCVNKIAKGKKACCNREQNTIVFFESFAEALRSNRTLESLQLSSYILRHKMALDPLAHVIADHPSLRSLTVSGPWSGRGHFEDDGTNALAHILENTKTLSSVAIRLQSLSSTEGGTGRAGTLCAALGRCKTLEKVKLVFTWMFAREKLLVANVVTVSHTLKELTLEWRSMNEGFLLALCEAVKEQTTGSLQKLVLTGRFAAKGQAELGRTFAGSKTLQRIKLHGNPFNDEGLQAFIDAVKKPVTAVQGSTHLPPRQVLMSGTVEGARATDVIQAAQLAEATLTDSPNINIVIKDLTPAAPDPLTGVKISQFTF
ncbi:NLRC4 [Branchiostoma lanceolatum]|uniref:NLRC4 protein n=1 Tax=Branchiostoma lanceolatum TaxID=7740 RepID=A0A8K0E731_BRALA|nr:NLRC4 [Branchiostoma lanceolatum]